MPELAFSSIGAFLSIWTPLHIATVHTLFDSQEVLQIETILTGWVLGRHKCVVNERIHKHTLFNYLFKVFIVIKIFLKIVVRYNDGTFIKRKERRY